MTAFTSPHLAELFALETMIVREDLQQDKCAALLASAGMFEEYRVPYVITGGVAVQLYTTHVRSTMDVDIVSLRKDFENLKKAAPWPQHGFELVFDRRRYIKLRHTASNVEVDINVDTRFARLLENPRIELVRGRPIPFCAPVHLAFAKLRTQRSDWPRDPGKRAQDRTDIIKMLQRHPSIAQVLCDDPMTTDEMRRVLDVICAELSKPSNDEALFEGDEPAA